VPLTNSGRHAFLCRSCTGHREIREWAEANAELQARIARHRETEASLKAPKKKPVLIEVGELKMRLGCTDCGYNAHPAALDFDHTDGKTRNVGKLRSMRAVLEEIERHKCEVVCANCHRIRTNNRKPGQLAAHMRRLSLSP
jgi:hypothetical protein